MLNISRPKHAYNLAIGSTSVNHQIATTSNITVVRLLATVTCCVRIGVATAADTTTTVRMAPMWPEYFLVNPGDTISVIDADGTTTGILNITELSR
jgi:hypothetical protein